MNRRPFSVHIDEKQNKESPVAQHICPQAYSCLCEILTYCCKRRATAPARCQAPRSFFLATVIAHDSRNRIPGAARSPKYGPRGNRPSMRRNAA